MINKKEIEGLFKKEIDKEILNNEILRTQILFSFFLFTSLFFLFFGYFRNEEFIRIFTKKMPLYTPSVFFIFSAAYFFLIRMRLKILLKREKKLPNLIRYINAFIEPSIVTFVMVFLCEIRRDYAIYVLLSPPLLVYFIFIIASGFRLSFFISFFTGFVSAFEYLILVFYYHSQPKEILPVDFLVQKTALIVRSAFLLVGGIIMGYIASQIQKRLLHSFSIINEKEKIKDLFGQHVSPEVVEKLVSQTELSTEINYVTVMFFDIRNFTHFSESRDPKEVVEYLNLLFDLCIKIINKRNGIINKFLGDGFMAIFGAPISNRDDVKNAVTAALEISKEIKRGIQEKRLANLNIGIGIHAGFAMAGNIGSSFRKEYTVIGDVVNLASRIEQLNKVYGTEILISEEVKKHFENSFHFVFLDEVKVKGRENTIKIYKIDPV